VPAEINEATVRTNTPPGIHAGAGALPQAFRLCADIELLEAYFISQGEKLVQNYGK
jgi:hypothetical protein